MNHTVEFLAVYELLSNTSAAATHYAFATFSDTFSPPWAGEIGAMC